MGEYRRGYGRGFRIGLAAGLLTMAALVAVYKFI